MDSSNRWWVYVIETESGKFYTGVTVDLNRRFLQHSGLIPGGAKFFRSDRPALLLFAKRAKSRSSAQVLESHLKSLSRKQKEILLFA